MKYGKLYTQTMSLYRGFNKHKQCHYIADYHFVYLKHFFVFFYIN